MKPGRHKPAQPAQGILRIRPPIVARHTPLLVTTRCREHKFGDAAPLKARSSLAAHPRISLPQTGICTAMAECLARISLHLMGVTAEYIFAARVWDQTCP